LGTRFIGRSFEYLAALSQSSSSALPLRHQKQNLPCLFKTNTAMAGVDFISNIRSFFYSLASGTLLNCPFSILRIGSLPIAMLSTVTTSLANFISILNEPEALLSESNESISR